MSEDQILYYLQYEDLTNLLSDFSKEFDFILVKTGLFDSPKLDFLDISINNNFLRNIPFGNWSDNDNFLIVPKSKKVFPRKIQRHDGTVKYAIDQLKNPDTLSFLLGGEYKEKVIIAGRIAFLNKGVFSTPAFKFLMMLFLKNVKKYNGWFVSEQLKQGYRLTTNIRLSEKYDFNINNTGSGKQVML